MLAIAFTVLDQTGAVIPNATVKATPQENAPQAAPASGATSSVGVAILDALVPARYTVETTFPGFDPPGPLPPLSTERLAIAVSRPL